MLKRFAIVLALGAAMFAGSTARGAMDLSARSTPHVSYDLPPLPDSIPSQLGWVPVKYVPNLKCLGVEAYGCFEPIPFRIQIRAGMSATTAWQSLEHERVHVIFYAADLHFAAEGMEDHVADVLGSGRVLEMRQTGR